MLSGFVKLAKMFTVPAAPEAQNRERSCHPKRFRRQRATIQRQRLSAYSLLHLIRFSESDTFNRFRDRRAIGTEIFGQVDV